MSPVRVELWLMRIFCGLPLWVSTMKGSKVVVPAIVLIRALGEFVPHQSFVAVTVVPPLLRFDPAAAVLPARRLKVMVNGPAAGNAPAFPVEIAPPLPLAVLPVIETLVRVAKKVHDAGQPVANRLI